jgi:hypothetical protein
LFHVDEGGVAIGRFHLAVRTGGGGGDPRRVRFQNMVKAVGLGLTRPAVEDIAGLFQLPSYFVPMVRMAVALCWI